MTPLDELIADPVVQLVVCIVLFIGIMDAFKTALDWVWKKLGGKDEDFR